MSTGADNKIIDKSLSPEEQALILKRLQRDFEFYAPRILKVQSTEADIVPFVLNKPQKLILQIFREIKRKRLLRVVILKGRRMGVSTLISGLYYRQTSWHANTYAMQVTHEPQASEFLFRMVKRFYDFTPDGFKPETRANNARLLEFNTKDGKGLNSAFRVATAGKDDIGSGQLIHHLHFSEVAKYPPENVDTILTAVLQCVPKLSNTSIILESTAKGIGGEFYERFWRAKYRYWIKRLDRNGEPVIEESVNPNADELNDYTSIFLPWFVFEKNVMQPPPGFSLTKEEEVLKKRFGLSDEQLYWRRYTIANECRGSVDVFQQEHPATPEEAFLGTGRPVFDNQKLQAWRDAAPKPKVRYEIHNGHFVAHPEGRFVVWEEPNPSGDYIIAADVAEGLAKGDFSVADVIDHRTGKQVAQWHGKCDPDEFGIILLAIGRRYNTAWIAPERNNHGLMTVTILVNENYPKVYCEFVPEPPGKPRKRYGWQTNSTTRPLILDNLVREVREGITGIQCAQTFEEMMSFKIQDNGKYEADPGRHDDRVISIAIAKYLRQKLDLPSMNRRDDIKRRRKGNVARRVVPSSGWT